MRTSFRRSNYRNTCNVNFECMWIQIFRSVDIGSVEADRKQGGRKESHPTYAKSVPIVVPVRDGIGSRRVCRMAN